jgi:glucose-1-phosphate thymidylyltransferase
MKALILAAGYARRLYPLTKEFPKPLLAVKHRPIIDYIIDKIECIREIDEIIVITNSKFMSRFRAWAAKHPTKKHITLVDDLTKTHSDRRGAIGDMNFAINKKRIKEDLLVIGGDNLFDGDLNDFLDFTKGHKNNPVIGAYNIRRLDAAREYGVIQLDKKDKVIDFEEKPSQPKSVLVAMCLYYFPKDKLRLIKEYLNAKANKHDATGFYIDWLTKKEPVFGFVFHGRWYDIGHHKFYEEAKQRFSMV